MSGYTRRELERAGRVVRAFEHEVGLDFTGRQRARIERAIAREFGTTRRGMILSLRNEIDKQTAKLPLYVDDAPGQTT